MNWNFDMAGAPRDGTPIWAAGKGSEVIKTSWVKARDGGYWPGFRQDGTSPPIAWQPFVKPVHPHHMVPADLSPVAAENIPIVDGVGGD